MEFSQAWMQERVSTRDSRYDGWLFVEKESLGVFCLSSCVVASADNSKPVVVEGADKASGKGLKPCRECRPHRFLKTFDSGEIKARKIMLYLAETLGETRTTAALAAQLDIQEPGWRERCRPFFHLEPQSFLEQMRIATCALQLRQTAKAKGATTACDLDEASPMGRLFEEHMGLRPASYANLGTLQDYTIQLPANYRQDLMEPYWLRDKGNLIFQRRAGWFWRSFQVGNGACLLRMRFVKDQLEVVFEEATPDLDGFQLHEQLRRILGLGGQTQAFEKQMIAKGHDRLIETRHGLRIVRTPTVFEALVWTILGQQINLAFAYKLRNRLIRLAGIPLGQGHFAHPTPQAVARLNPETLRSHQFSKAKANYLVGISQRIVDGFLDLESLPGEPIPYIERILQAERGIGLWTARYVAMRGCGYGDCVPVGDAGLRRSLQAYFSLETAPGPAETETLMEAFSPYRSLATFHLWRLFA